MLAQPEAGNQGEFMRPELQRLGVALQHQRQHDALFIFIMRCQLPRLNPRKAVCRFARRAEPRPADRNAATNRLTRCKETLITQPEYRLFAAGLPGDEVRALKRNGCPHFRVTHNNGGEFTYLALGEGDRSRPYSQ
ncbi:hypothetical protein QVD17_42485 [Tagetes erecta]|uniref:Uncharacterized protein n=1 Tax=Tagetes erecta TaxID=13708 RepID=A0AAD8JLU1_TARER|nr:hypothetical protein QVD17_42485 [Tagetes erecta]